MGDQARGAEERGGRASPEGVFSADADWIALVDAALVDGPDLAAWASRLSDLLDHVAMGDLRAHVLVVQHDEEGVIRSIPASAGGLAAFADPLGWLQVVPLEPDSFRMFFYPRAMVMTHGDLRADGSARDRELLELVRAELGRPDALALLLHPAPGFVAVMMFVGRDDMTPTRAERRRLTWLGLHIEAALRMQLRPASLRAVMEPTGRIEHRESAAVDEQPKGAMQSVRDAHRTGRSGGEALALWPALAAGELSVVERRIGTRPQYHFFDNPPHRQPLFALSIAEQDAVAAISRAESSKAAAYELGTTESAISRRLARASSKLGLCSTMDLVRLAATLARDPRARFERIALTPTEEQVLELVRRGLSNAEIAKIRARSARTIANQVASLLRKAQAPNRRALVSRALLADEPSRCWRPRRRRPRDGPCDASRERAHVRLPAVHDGDRAADRARVGSAVGVETAAREAVRASDVGTDTFAVQGAAAVADAVPPAAAGDHAPAQAPTRSALLVAGASRHGRCLARTVAAISRAITARLVVGTRAVAAARRAGLEHRAAQIVRGDIALAPPLDVIAQATVGLLAVRVATAPVGLAPVGAGDAVEVRRASHRFAAVAGHAFLADLGEVALVARLGAARPVAADAAASGAGPRAAAGGFAAPEGERGDCDCRKERDQGPFLIHSRSRR